MAATIHHLSFGTLCPFGERLVTGEGGLGATEIVCHSLLIEADDELVLVETGFGTEDARHPVRRLGLGFNLALRPKPRESETALARIKAMGLDPADVRHITVTHLDLDHAGGLPDFPGAGVHVFEAEQRAALDPGLRERPRYRRAHFAHGPKWVTYASGGDEWMGFESIRVIEGVGAEIALIPLPGHSRGHCAVAVRDSGGWLLHCGDAYFNHGEVRRPPSCPPGIRAFEAATAHDNATRKANQERLRELAATRGDEVELFCAHDPADLARFTS